MSHRTMDNRGRRLTDAAESRLRRRNTRLLARYAIGIVAWVLVCAEVFTLLMAHAEGQRASFLTGIYWTLSTMSTLGLGDIVFESTIGRLYTVLVLLSGLLLLFVVFPFAFIRFFYAPWLEARRVPDRLSGHVIIASFRNVAAGLVHQLEARRIPYYVIEPDPIHASHVHEDGISVFTGDWDDRATYLRLQASTARVVVANHDDTINANITLTVREVAPDVPVVALVESDASIDILELAGATHVLALKTQLGQRLAQRVNAGHAQAHRIGSFHGLTIAEFTVFNTPFVGKPLREITLREEMGLNVVGVLEQATFTPARPDLVLNEHSVPVVVGTDAQLDTLNEFLVIYNANYSPVLVIGGGKVGQAAARMLKRRGVPVHMVEKEGRLRGPLGSLPDRLIIGDAAEREVLIEAGLLDAPAVLITSNDDAMNIYLSLYCRRLSPDVRVVSRITHDRNVEAVRRAGADLVLSHLSIGVEAVLAAAAGGDMVTLGENLELHELATPASVANRTLADLEIASHTGLNVLAVRRADGTVQPPAPQDVIDADSHLIVTGERSQLQAFADRFA